MVVWGRVMKVAKWSAVALIGWCLHSGMADAHPFSQEEYSLRTAVTISERGVVPW